MANIVKNKLTILGPANDLELLKVEIEQHGKWEGGYYDYEVHLWRMRDLERPGQVIEFETMWTPAYKFLKKITQKYPRLVFCTSFLEEDYLYGRLIHWRGHCISSEEYYGMDEKDHTRAFRFFRNHKVTETRGRKLFSRYEELKPEWLAEC